MIYLAKSTSEDCPPAVRSPGHDIKLPFIWPYSGTGLTRRPFKAESRGSSPRRVTNMAPQLNRESASLSRWRQWDRNPSESPLRGSSNGRIPGSYPGDEVRFLRAQPICSIGEIGKHAGLKYQCESFSVQVRNRAPICSRSPIGRRQTT